MHRNHHRWGDGRARRLAPAGCTKNASFAAAPAETRAVAVPVIDVVTASVAVTVWLPTCVSVTPSVKVCVPLSPATKVYDAGSVAPGSELVKFTVPV